jgi:hypothetical protein
MTRHLRRLLHSATPPFFDKTLAEVHARQLREAPPLASARARFADVRELLRALAGVLEEQRRSVAARALVPDEGRC